MIRRWLILLLFLFPLGAFAAPGQVTLTWDAPATCANAEPLAADMTLTYTLYQANQPGGYDFQQPWLTGLTATTLTLSAPGKQYWVVTATGQCGATLCCAGESAPSNEVLTHQTGNPKRLR